MGHGLGDSVEKHFHMTEGTLRNKAATTTSKVFGVL